MKGTSIQINQADLDRIKRDFRVIDSEVIPAQVRIVNRALQAVNTQGSVKVRKYYNLPAARVKKNFSIRKATRSSLNGYWRSKGAPVGLINFKARQNKKGVSVKVMVGGDRETIPGAFIQIGKNSTQHVFWREKKNGVRVARYDIHRLEGPRIEDALAKPEVQRELQKTVDETIEKRLEAEANYLLQKAKT